VPLDPNEEKEWEFGVPTPEGAVLCNIRKIASSNIKWVGWPKDGGKPLMFVEFQDGSRYVYYNISRQKVVALANAESTGKYFHRHIRGKGPVLKLR